MLEHGVLEVWEGLPLLMVALRELLVVWVAAKVMLGGSRGPKSG